MRILGTPIAPPELEVDAKRATKGSAPDAAEAVVVAPELAQASSTHAKSEAKTEARLAVVKAQVEAGSYKVDLDKLAERIVDEERARAGLE